MDITRYGIVMHIKDGDGNWHVSMDNELFETEDDAYESEREYPRFCSFDREIRDAFTSVTPVKCYA